MKKLFREMMVLFLGGAFALSMSSCESEEERENGDEKDWVVKSKNMVTRYVFPEEMSIRHECDSSRILFYVRTEGLAVGHGLEAGLEFRNLNEEELSERARLFDSMAIVYKDTSYNGNVPIVGNWALAYPIDSISIISSTDYDKDHPAGSDLSDVVGMETYSYGECVLSDYSEERVGIGIDSDKKVAELTQANRTLLCAHYYGLYNTGVFSIPQTSHPQACQLTVTYFFSNGRILSASARMEL